MARRNRPMGPPPRRLSTGQPPARRARRGNNGKPPALKARVGYPPGQPHPCRQYLARQAFGVIEDETTEEG